jgi:hypothetical protein
MKGAAVAVVSARDDRLKFPVDAALAKGQNYKGELDPQVKLYFGRQPKLKVAKTLGEYQACDIAFFSAAVSLQQRAKQEGGNAVALRGTVVTLGE